MSDVRRTEADGVRATWRLDYPYRIAILDVYDLLDDCVVISFRPDECPDLVQVRERLPELERLWDAVRHDFWVGMIPRAHGAAMNDATEANRRTIEERHADELPSIRPWILAIEEKAGSGYHVEREPDPPYGWNLFDRSGVKVCSGSLDRLELWVIRRRD
ncbi:hypothetical protein IU500_02500 [Nocardia terpenica]|uniref:hypothetical protein n=1 Tax=Nocardia terpenica TaxID=455432 RepID=UPI001893992E|nr:hypothetical protein [Nocardia terpenica]MBF6059553.1 hypothetical protein [Nocardia terpenica]MBF6102908.1 hypothetical protein [Nocardia terpenica]MBF6110903.1 hypothetical protein [Nocardia terpenica]MBF6117034.1 hypothetical protein [Nocardia terpenica]MBF6151128.1 hypothetical protein [Nocardia terpenica]